MLLAGAVRAWILPPTTNPPNYDTTDPRCEFAICISVLGAWKEDFSACKNHCLPSLGCGEARARAENAWFGDIRTAFMEGVALIRLTLEVVTAGSPAFPDFCTEALEATHPPPALLNGGGEWGLSLVPHPENCLVFILLLPEVRSLELLWAQLPSPQHTEKEISLSSSPRAKSSLVCVPVSAWFTQRPSNSGSCFPLPSLLPSWFFFFHHFNDVCLFLKHTIQ